MDFGKNFLNRFGTDYLEPEEHAPELKKKYYDFLVQPWIKRGKGISYDAMMAIVILIVFPLFLFGGVPIFLIAQRGQIIGMTSLSSAVICIYGVCIFGIMFLVLSRLNINYRTRANTFTKYPLVCKAAYKLINTSSSEIIRDYIPILKVDGKTVFYIAYIQKGDKKKTPVGILLLDDQGRAIYDDELFRKAVLTAYISITCGHLVQQKAVNMRRSMKSVINKLIPNMIRVVKQQEQQFSEHGMASQWQSVIENASILPQALIESMSILDAEDNFRRAMGYAFALEFQYEDALKLKELYLAYVRYMNSAYRNKIVSLTTNSSMLIQNIKAIPDWRGQKQILSALSALAVAGPNGILSWVHRLEYEGALDKGELEAYHGKTLQAQGMGWPTLSH
jgi:hypothetical protein